MKQDVLIEIAQEDIQIQFRCLTNECPIAKAVNRKIIPDLIADVNNGRLTLIEALTRMVPKNDEDEFASYLLPPIARNFQIVFDSPTTDLPAPVSFMISIDKEFIREGV